ncbi:hypothetical protein B0I35DRAFT_347987 [Stachybotrys elegans]|uniref:NAD(P)-binding domain-containing protein n=1 Tax=Stachybotrys elegans TaxID=80388 RepID=A0A8K0WV93_9HYPO|nr:hypothetical protein B0I35DRAFT_347987 [Stachybotrys elegans]
MRIVIAPASTKAAAATIRSLLSLAKEDIQIKGYYRNLSRVPAEFQSSPRFQAVEGTIEDASSLDFAGCDAVLTITPPSFSGRDLVSHAKEISENVKAAVEKAGSVKRLVLLSSVGAEHDTGVGEIKSNNMAERVFAETPIPELIFVRCVYFMENWTFFLDTLHGPEPHVISTITPVDFNVPMVAVQDVGSTLASELVKESAPPSKPFVFELHGPKMYSPLDVQSCFSKAVGQDVAMKPVEKHELHNFYARLFPPEIVDDWVEMATSFLPGGIIAVDKVNWDEKEIVRGKTELCQVIESAVQNRQQG